MPNVYDWCLRRAQIKLQSLLFLQCKLDYVKKLKTSLACQLSLNSCFVHTLFPLVVSRVNTVSCNEHI